MQVRQFAPTPTAWPRPLPAPPPSPGLFAIGDVRSGLAKRVASGVGEGSVVIQAVHQFLNPGVA